MKRYTEPLGKNEKDAVENSLATLMKDPRWSDLNVKEWHLVLPWDPSPEADKWLHGIGEGHGVRAIWNGLTRVESLAAKYPEVIDYYLHGGRSRMEEAYKVVATAFSATKAANGLSVPAVHETVETALQTLEDDPHYRYEHRFGSGGMPPVSSRPGLVLHMASQDSVTGNWAVVDVIARCAASSAERPIQVEGRLTIATGSPAHKSFEDFIAYGSPFQSPQGSFSGTIDAPGGLGRALEEATVSVWSTNNELGGDPELRLEILAPDMTVLGSVDLDRVERSHGAEGYRVVLKETNGVFEMEDRYNVSGNNSSRIITLNNLTDMPISKVLPAVTFLQHCHSPNIGRLSRRYAPPEKGVFDSNLALQWPEAFEKRLTMMVQLLGFLAKLQSETGDVIKVPDTEAVQEEEIKGWQLADRLLQGLEVSVTYKEEDVIFIGLDGDTPEGSFEASLPLEFTVGQQKVALQVIARFDNPIILGHRDIEGSTYTMLETPEHSVKYRLERESAS
ncbi:hypothetical protein AOZ07_08245 [Glutamicibacter halophytocola]|nr:hypothetical protein AOZ07_08245 [Glutamicibacter halophytocola]